MRPEAHIDLGALPAALAADLPHAFPHLVRALQDSVYSGALRLTGSPADAEEITQEAFVRAYGALSRYPEEQVRALQARAWVWTIAANLCRNRARHRRRHPEAPLPRAPADPDPTPGPEQQALAVVERDRLAAHLARLPWPVRAAVVLRHVAGLGYPEIAEALSRPVGTVKSDVHRALQRLKTWLEEEP